MPDGSRQTSRLFQSVRAGGVALSLVLVSVGGAQSASAREHAGDQGARAPGRVVALAIPKSVSTPIGRAQTALAAAEAAVKSRQYVNAAASLRTLRFRVVNAHKAGMAQIGAPPTDPESDDTPGPPSVIAVLNLEHNVGVRVVALFNGMTQAPVLDSLRYTLWTTHSHRDIMLKRVTALPPEGAGADYSDGMSDTAGIYTNEVNVVTAALKTYQLNAEGRVGLQRALKRVRATKALFDKAYGGGE